MIRSALLFPVKLTGVIAFFYTVGGGWIIFPPAIFFGCV